MDTTLPAPRAAESSLHVGGVHCAACCPAVEQALRGVPGVREAVVHPVTHLATVRWDPSAARFDDLLAAVERAGYAATPDTLAAARLRRRDESRATLWRLFVAAFCAMQVMMLATPAYVSEPGDLAADHKRLLDWGSWLLTLPVLGFAARPFFGGAWSALRHGRVGMDVPVAAGIAIAFIASSGAAFDPGGWLGDEVWFDSLTMFVSFLLAGRWLEQRMRHRAEEALEATTQRIADTALRVRADGGVDEVDVRALRPGDHVRVPAGQAFPADGTLLDGTTLADEALLTGESRPQPRSAGDAVVAGSLNLASPVSMRVERTGADTRYEAIVALMRHARTQRPALLASADRWAAPFLVLVLGAAAAAGVAWSLIDPSRVVAVMVAVLIVTCPCALSLAAPSALLAAAAAIGRRGVLLRRIDAIEGLARMQTLFVDKTGTLTQPRLRLAAVERVGEPADERPDDEAAAASLHGIAASLASWSRHPLAASLREGSPAVAMEWHDIREEPGHGIEATDVQGHVWRLGSSAWIADKPLRPPPREKAAEGGGDLPISGDDPATHTLLARDGRPQAVFRFDEQLRPDARAAVQALRADGVQVRLLSGDAPARVRRIAVQLGLPDGAGGQTPADKLAAVREAQRRGDVVAMLGDGINDAPVLARADVSLAMGEGAQIARAQADGVLVSDRLSDLAAARRLAVRARRVVRQNIAWAAAYNAACVPLALAGWLPPWAAGLGMAASSLFVVLNSLRLAR